MVIRGEVEVRLPRGKSFCFSCTAVLSRDAPNRTK
jgi:hypothetical protein